MAVANPVVTEEEYLALAEASETKLEFVDGEIRMMAGGSASHGGIQYNLPYVLRPLTDARKCRGYASDTRVKVREGGQYVYPDLSVACPKGDFEGTSLLNPILIVEVLSPSTAPYDRGSKLDLYLTLASLEEYLLIHSEIVRVERYRRQGDVWLYESVRGREARIGCLGGEIGLAELYQDVEIDSPSG